MWLFSPCRKQLFLRRFSSGSASSLGGPLGSCQQANTACPRQENKQESEVLTCIRFHKLLRVSNCLVHFTIIWTNFCFVSVCLLARILIEKMFAIHASFDQESLNMLCEPTAVFGFSSLQSPTFFVQCPVFSLQFLEPSHFLTSRPPSISLVQTCVDCCFSAAP